MIKMVDINTLVLCAVEIAFLLPCAPSLAAPCNPQISTRIVRARQVGEGLQRRLQHANEKFAKVRDEFTQASLSA